MKYQLTSADLKKHLKDQIQFLISFSKSYDDGNYNQAKLMAVSLRVLLHDTPKSHSLLTQLKKETIQFYDSAYVDDVRFCRPIVSLLLLSGSHSTDGESTYEPLLDRSFSDKKIPKIDFNSWWNQIVIKDNNENSFSRFDLVYTVSNKDGGAHVDPKIDYPYAALSRENSLGFKVVIKGKSIDWDAHDLGLSDKDYVKIKNKPELASVRQITYEVLKTLKDEFPDCFE